MEGLLDAISKKLDGVAGDVRELSARIDGLESMSKRLDGEARIVMLEGEAH